jgi:hypothetical protein
MPTLILAAALRRRCHVSGWQLQNGGCLRLRRVMRMPPPLLLSRALLQIC